MNIYGAVIMPQTHCDSSPGELSQFFCILHVNVKNAEECAMNALNYDRNRQEAQLLLR